MNSYLNDEKCINRLVKEYNKYKNLIIGFDFDSTIFDTKQEKLDLMPIINLLKRASDANLTMCLFSLSLHDYDVKSKINHCKTIGINVHYINESPILKNSFPIDKKKPCFSILLDDRAGLSSSFNILTKTLNTLKL